ncbi:guanine nucleotide-binding protein G(I)/G(S)/G(O) subunit gamma-2 isoform X1 [Lontra canadensis]|uniref:guanine nucleotide-binding protein G(I)/G(S)/G(O) subunit gamma-2 isoform X1 n=1 Tax=Lontra canadensis TaxID=76717 RepID=UPI0013F36F91|nr:guanine nucleotide-binding protein G(I)/G(S)/G(O) subunit gamma-2 isoform X1 [Lontra canadensis]
MIEDKAGWGLVPGLQAPLLHTHSAQRRPLRGSSYYCWAGRRGAGCAGRAARAAPGLACTLRLPHRRPAALPPAAGAKPRSASEPQALGTEENKIQRYKNQRR